MTLATEVGIMYRRLSSALNAQAIRSEDVIRATRTGGPVTDQLERIAKQAQAAESALS